MNFAKHTCTHHLEYLQTDSSLSNLDSANEQEGYKGDDKTKYLFNGGVQRYHRLFKLFLHHFELKSSQRTQELNFGLVVT